MAPERAGRPFEEKRVLETPQTALRGAHRPHATASLYSTVRLAVDEGAFIGRYGSSSTRIDASYSPSRIQVSEKTPSRQPSGHSYLPWKIASPPSTFKTTPCT